MKVEIWSDIICPFCYIGKRKFEKAWATFSNKEEVEIVWRSYQLDPEMKTVPGQSVNEYLAARKGMSVAQAKQMNDYVSQSAKAEGLTYHLDKAIIGNTLNAHRLLHLAANHGVQDKVKENLFAAYFTEGKNIDDQEVLIAIGKSAGLEESEIKKMLESEAYKNEVRQDQYEAFQIGVRGVPFFVFNNKYAVSGAQPSEVFAEVLTKVWQEEQPQITQGAVCTPDGVCN